MPGEQEMKEQELNEMIDSLTRQNKFVFYSPSRRFVYVMGLIDYLGKWNLQRRGEMVGKIFLAHFARKDTDFSVKPPHEFARRFLKKVKQVFKPTQMEIVELSEESNYQFNT